MSELKTTDHYDEMEDRLIVKYEQDLTPYRDENKALKNGSPEFGKYKSSNSGLVHVAKVPELLVIQMRNGTCCPDGVKYDMLAADPEEAKRAMLHMQTYHNDAFIVDGKPISKKKAIWE